MAIEKLTTWLKIKIWTNPQIKNHKKKSHELKLIRPYTPQKSKTRIFKFL